MFNGHPLDTTRQVRFPVGLWTSHRINGRTLFAGEITVPAKIHQHLHRKFGISILNFRANTVNTFGQQVIPISFHAKARTEGQTTF